MYHFTLESSRDLSSSIQGVSGIDERREISPASISCFPINEILWSCCSPLGKAICGY